MTNNYLITGYHGEPHVTAENDRGIHAGAFGAGRFVLPVGERFRAEYIGNNTIRMYDGKLMDNGAAAGIPAGEYVDFLIANAEQGMKRNDLIVFQYSQDASTLIESGSFHVIQGTETSATPTDPTITQSDLLSGTATFDQMALWRIRVTGTDISEPVKVFDLFDRLKLNRWSYDAYTAEEDLERVQEILDVMGDAESGGIAVGYALCNRNFSVDQSPTHNWLYRIESINRNYARIEATTSLGTGMTMQRVRINGVWQPWEHLTPGMLVEQEYRTTERWLGKPVYTKLVRYYTGSGMGNANGLYAFSIVFSTPNFADLVRYSGSVSGLGRPIPCFYNQEDGGGYIGVNFMNHQGLSMVINKKALPSGIEISVQVWYTKTTD